MHADGYAAGSRYFTLLVALIGDGFIDVRKCAAVKELAARRFFCFRWTSCSPLGNLIHVNMFAENDLRRGRGQMQTQGRVQR